jgi:NAD(P)-dependent dehydrogenase (short-subunit alcohol dehydrogenase family)
MRTLVVVGAGPGIGIAAARRFAREGWAVGLLARSGDRLAALADSLTPAARWATADATDPVSIASGLEALDIGVPDTVLFSPLPSTALIKPVLDTSPRDLMAALTLSAGGPAGLVSAVAPGMIDRGSGTLLFTSGSGALTPSADRAASAVATTALTVYVRLLHDALRPHGVHVAHLTISGAVGSGLVHEPDAVAELLWDVQRNPAEPFPVLSPPPDGDGRDPQPG